MMNMSMKRCIKSVTVRLEKLAKFRIPRFSFQKWTYLCSPPTYHLPNTCGHFPHFNHLCLCLILNAEHKVLTWDLYMTFGIKTHSWPHLDIDTYTTTGLKSGEINSWTLHDHRIQIPWERSRCTEDRPILKKNQIILQAMSWDDDGGMPISDQFLSDLVPIFDHRFRTSGLHWESQRGDCSPPHSDFTAAGVQGSPVPSDHDAWGRLLEEIEYGARMP